MSRYLHHVTLTTGHTRRSWRHEISHEAMQLAAELLDAALAVSETRGRVPVPGLPAVLSATASGRCVIATVWGSAPIGGTPAPLVTFGAAGHSRCAAALWPLLGGAEADRPATPWCGARIEPTAVLASAETMGAIGDLERCIAWAWIDRCGVLDDDQRGVPPG